jgi:DNA-binding CsgD family transcriptional regulator
LERARAGRSGALVVLGEPGIGKSALLDYAARRAAGTTVVRALGVESEAELEFSALLDVCRPLLHRLPLLPRRQADALAGALGLGPAEAVDRLAIGAAILGLLTSAAEQAPVLVLVDDAQWLDRSSADALLYAARRLEAERVAILFAVRQGDERRFEAPGVESMWLDGLAPDDAAELLASRTPVPVAPNVLEAIYAATRGNPLATVELPRCLTAEQLSGREALVDPLPAGATLKRAFADRVAALPDPARTAILAAAVSPSGELEPVVAALAHLGVDGAWLEPAEDAALLMIDGGRLVFRHPIVRSAVFHAAAPSERRAAHRALADALTGRHRADERAWHLAAASLGPDEEAADALADSARRARARSGYASAAAALERAARLTPEDGLRRERLHEAAEAAWLAGRKETGIALVEEALGGCEDPALRARLLHLRGHIERIAGNLTTGIDLLLEAADLAEPNDPAQAVVMLAEAVLASWHSGAPARALAAGARARALAPEDGSAADFFAELALGQALFVNGRAGEGVPRLERMLRLLEERDELAADPVNLVCGSIAAGRLDRATEGLELAERAAALARERGAYASLNRALGSAGWHARRLGRWDEAYAYSSEALALARESGETTVVVHTLTHLATIEAARGDEDACEAHAAEAIQLARPLGLGTEWAERALALLDLGLGRVERVAERLEALDGEADLVETYYRLGARGRAEAAFERWLAFGARTSNAETGATAARAAGLLAGDKDYEKHFRRALELHAAAEDAFGAARTRLCLGERLRRTGRRVDARRELRGALDAFEELGAEPWAERARAELRASGAKLRRRLPHEGEELTPQEHQIALHVAEGKRNKEVAAALLLSHKTVDFHLRRIYRKLDVRSRGELIRLFAVGT